MQSNPTVSSYAYVQQAATSHFSERYLEEETRCERYEHDEHLNTRKGECDTVADKVVPSEERATREAYAFDDNLTMGTSWKSSETS
jgi:5-methylcytosine-specific restriction endonuclease McrA